MPHKVYYKIIDYVREKKIKFNYLGRSVNQELLEAEMIDILRERV